MIKFEVKFDDNQQPVRMIQYDTNPIGIMLNLAKSSRVNDCLKNNDKITIIVKNLATNVEEKFTYLNE